jgi:hypothetical protein
MARFSKVKKNSSDMLNASWHLKIYMLQNKIADKKSYRTGLSR